MPDPRSASFTMNQRRCATPVAGSPSIASEASVRPSSWHSQSALPSAGSRQRRLQRAVAGVEARVPRTLRVVDAFVLAGRRRVRGVVQAQRHCSVDRIDIGGDIGSRGNSGRHDGGRAEREGGETFEHAGHRGCRGGKVASTDYKGIRSGDSDVPSPLNRPTAPAG